MSINRTFITNSSSLHVGAQNIVGAFPTDTTAAQVRNFFKPTGASAMSASTAYASGDIVSIDDFEVTAFFKVKTAISSETFDTLPSMSSLFESPMFDFYSAEVPNVSSIGDLSNESTVVDLMQFGRAFKEKLTGQLDGGQLDNEIFWVPGNPIHNWLRNTSESGERTVAGIAWRATDSVPDAQVYLAAFNSFVSSFSISTAFDEAGKATIAFPVDGKEHFYSLA